MTHARVFGLSVPFSNVFLRFGGFTCVFLFTLLKTVTVFESVLPCATQPGILAHLVTNPCTPRRTTNPVSNMPPPARKAPRGSTQFKRTPLQLACEEEWGDQTMHPQTGAGLLSNFLAEPDCPAAFESVFACLPPPASETDEDKAWLNDTVLALHCTYIQAGMPNAHLTKQAAPVHPGVCILGPLAVSSVQQAHNTGDYNNLLKWLRAHCKFDSLKRVVFPANVSMNKDNKYVFAEAGKGTHWMEVFLCLETDTIDLHDWVRLTDSCYEELLPSLRAFMMQMHKR